MTKRFRVREGNTGILYLTDENGKEERYIPDNDLEKTRALLLEFQELKDLKGHCLKDNYWMEGYNWYPTMVSYLYWHAFFRYVQYKPLVERLIGGEAVFEFENEADFYHLVSIISGEDKHVNWKTFVFYAFVKISNWRVLRKYRTELLFFRFSLNDFRSVEIRKVLDGFGARYIEVVPPGRFFEVLRYFLQSRPYYYFGGLPSRNIFNHQYDITGIPKHKRFVFERVIEKTERMISGYIREYKRHLRRLKNMKIKTFYGFDDCNGYVFPILYACQRNSIKTIGHQHGAYVKRHAGYIMEGVDKRDYKWFDKVIVWGDYWKEHLLRISNVYSPEMLVVGSNKISWNYGAGRTRHSKPKSILLPYEFTSNSYKIGRFIAKFIDLGYDVYFKPRSDERLEDLLNAYCLPQDYLNKIRIVEKIDSAFMENIDIIAGTMTTLVYELLPYNKIIWILDTEYKHLEDLVEGGYAHKVRYEDLDALDERYFRRTEVDADYFFSTESLKDTLLKHVLN